MLGIDEATRLINKIYESNIEIYGLMITNSVNKHFGSLYVRTNLEFMINTILWPDQTYISYGAYGIHITKELQDECNKNFEEQKQDIKTLSNKILSIFPKAEICVILSPYFCFEYTECIITGDISYSYIYEPIKNAELKRSYQHALEYLQHQKEHYHHIQQWQNNKK